MSKKFLLGPCPDKGKKGYCDGRFNGVRCPVKYAFFGVIELLHGWKEEEGKRDGSCPEWVKWGVKWKSSNEFIEIIDGGQLPGFRKCKGPCLFQVMKFTNTDVQSVFKDAFSRIPNGNDELTRYFRSINTPADIRQRALKRCSHYNEPRIKNNV
jgi:hypothetical protein